MFINRTIYRNVSRVTYKLRLDARAITYVRNGGLRNQNTATVNSASSESRVRSAPKTMVRILNVAEKNDAAKSISEHMSRGAYRKVMH